jgi:large-conductance mechanosensitive channel
MSWKTFFIQTPVQFQTLFSWTNAQLVVMGIGSQSIETFPIFHEATAMLRKILTLLLFLTILPTLTSGQNTTLPLEDAGESKMLAIQNQIYELQQLSDSLKEHGETLAKALEELSETSLTHGQDILTALDAINTLNTTSLETGETLGQEIAAIKKIQTETARKHETILAELADQKKEFLAAIDTIERKQQDLLNKQHAQLTQRDDGLEKNIASLQATVTNQDELIIKLQKQINLAQSSLSNQQKEIEEVKEVISSQKTKTIGHLSSLENINATLAGLKEQSRSELESIHQSLTQVVTYGLLTIVSVTLLLIIILIFIRRKPARQTTKEHSRESSPQPPVREEDDEILDWLKEKNRD